MLNYKNKYDTHYKTHYQRHAESRTGSILLTLVLAMLLLLMIFGRISAVEQEQYIEPKSVVVNKQIAMRIQDSNILREKNKIQESSVVTRTIPEPAPRKIRKFSTPEVPTNKKNTQKVQPVKKDSVMIDSQKTNSEEKESKKTSGIVNNVREEKKSVNISGENEEKELAELLSKLLEYVEEYKSYPNSARRAGYEGVVEIAVSFNKNGFIIGYSLSKSSSYNLLDNAALGILKKLQTVQIKQISLEKNITIVVPIRYNLN